MTCENSQASPCPNEVTEDIVLTIDGCYWMRVRLCTEHANAMRAEMPDRIKAVKQ